MVICALPTVLPAYPTVTQNETRAACKVERGCFTVPVLSASYVVRGTALSAFVKVRNGKVRKTTPEVPASLLVVPYADSVFSAFSYKVVVSVRCLSSGYTVVASSFLLIGVLSVTRGRVV